MNCTSSIELVGVPIRQGWQELPPITFCHGLETAGAVKLALGDCIICLIAGAVKAGAG